jgi:hypothetical protein
VKTRPLERDLRLVEWPRRPACPGHPAYAL